MPNYITIIFRILFANVILLFGCGLEPLIEHYSEEITSNMISDYQYILKAPVEEENGEKMELYTLDTWYQLGKTNISVSFMGISENSTFYQDLELPENEDEIIVTKPLAQKLNLKLGDTLTFTDDYYEKDYTLTVSGIYDDKSSLGAFMKLENLNRLLDQDADSFNCYISNEKLDIDELYLAKYITRADMVGAASQMMKSFNMVIQFVNIFSIVIYMCF